MISFIFSFFSFFMLMPLEHDFHTSIAEVNFNTKNNTWEVSLRVFTDDLENILSKIHKKDIKIEKNDTKNDAMIQKYIQENFELIYKKQKANFKWIGKEVEADAVWNYFELKFDKKNPQFQVKNSILIETFDDQLNITNFIYQKTKKTFICQKGDFIHSIQF
ncbi:MAG: hypothetical protein EAZ85_11950 [Bacteroidetes bacterium]|nr:MAG: hypothetical protein EAZ85_11950 [Bacteroidota bacterium]